MWSAENVCHVYLFIIHVSLIATSQPLLLSTWVSHRVFITYSFVSLYLYCIKFQTKTISLRAERVWWLRIDSQAADTPLPPSSSPSSLLCLYSMFFLSWDKPNWVLCLLHSLSSFWFMFHLTPRLVWFLAPCRGETLTSSSTWHFVLMAECWLCSLDWLLWLWGEGWFCRVTLGMLFPVIRLSGCHLSPHPRRALNWGVIVCGTLQLLLLKYCL